jgi:Stigma-specific protein, Stig1
MTLSRKVRRWGSYSLLTLVGACSRRPSDDKAASQYSASSEAGAKAAGSSSSYVTCAEVKSPGSDTTQPIVSFEYSVDSGARFPLSKNMTELGTQRSATFALHAHLMDPEGVGIVTFRGVKSLLCGMPPGATANPCGGFLSETRKEIMIEAASSVADADGKVKTCLDGDATLSMSELKCADAAPTFCYARLVVRAWGENLEGGRVMSPQLVARACAAPKAACGDNCLDLKTDRANCGACATKCGETQRCVDGVCK